MTRLATILAEQKVSYAAVARRADVQPRTLRQIATGETPIDNVAVGTVRRIAAALQVSVASLVEPEAPWPGDLSLDRATRLSRAVREVMWAGSTAPYPSPVENGEPDDLALVTPDEFFARMPPIDARHG